MREDFPDFTGPTIPANRPYLPPDCPPVERAAGAACGIWTRLLCAALGVFAGIVIAALLGVA